MFISCPLEQKRAFALSFVQANIFKFGTRYKGEKLFLLVCSLTESTLLQNWVGLSSFSNKIGFSPRFSTVLTQFEWRDLRYVLPILIVSHFSVFELFYFLFLLIFISCILKKSSLLTFDWIFMVNFRKWVLIKDFNASYR